MSPTLPPPCLKERQFRRQAISATVRALKFWSFDYYDFHTSTILDHIEADGTVISYEAAALGKDGARLS